MTRALWQLVAIMRQDIYIHGRFIGLYLMILTTGMPIAHVFSLFSADVTWSVPLMFGTMLSPMLFAWYFVGFEKTWKTDVLLRSLPVPHAYIASLKVANVFLWSLAGYAATVAVQRYLGYASPDVLIEALKYGPPVLFAASIISVSVYLIVPQQIALYVLLGFWIGSFAAGQKLMEVEPLPTAAFLTIGIAITIAMLIFGLASKKWAEGR